MWKYNPITTELEFTKPSTGGDSCEISDFIVLTMTVLNGSTLVIHGSMDILENGYVDLLGDIEMVA
jgi:hypothetical protein